MISIKYFMSKNLCLTLSIIRHGSRVKWSNPGKGEAPSLTPWCSSYRKGSLWVSLDNGANFTYFINNNDDDDDDDDDDDYVTGLWR